MTNERTKQENPNSNCLEGMLCPQCGSYEPFSIDVTTSVTVHDSGAETDGDLEWGEASHCRCMKCDHAATVADFREAQTDDDEGE